MKYSNQIKKIQDNFGVIISVRWYRVGADLWYWKRKCLKAIHDGSRSFDLHIVNVKLSADKIDESILSKKSTSTVVNSKFLFEKREKRKKKKKNYGTSKWIMLNKCETENANANAYSLISISITIYKNQSKRRSY